MLGCTKDDIYDLLRDRRLHAYTQAAAPAPRAIESWRLRLKDYLEAGQIKTEQWSEWPSVYAKAGLIHSAPPITQGLIGSP